MTTAVSRRPNADEYHEFFAGYVALVPDGDILDILRAQLAEVLELLGALPAEKHDFAYAPGKWSLKQVLGHIIDGEWVFTYRALRFSRGDDTALAGMDQDVFMDGSNYAQRSLDDMLREFQQLRQASLTLFESFSPEMLDRAGVASDLHFTVRALIYFNAGHAAHHLGVLRDHYLSDAGDLS